MRRIPLILATLALLVALASPVAARLATVTNPMTATLDGGGYDITNVANLTLGSKLTVGEGVIWLDSNHARPLIMQGPGDPRTTFLGVTPALGSLYLQFTNPGTVWILVGWPDDWRQIATT